VLVGFSIGTRVILGALERAGGNVRMLRGVYFLGSALTRDTTLTRDCLPRGMKIVNYHSPLRDRVNRISFTFMNELPAGGQAGFDDTDVFDNYRVSCAHAHKGVGIHADYSQLAPAIGYIALFREGVLVGGEVAHNLTTPVGTGKIWWNKVLRVRGVIDGIEQELEIEQHNLVADYFRALAVGPDGARRRVARGANMHALLMELGVKSRTARASRTGDRPPSTAIGGNR
jgi:hypothetical protein